jgi:hypothetical protein
VDREKIEWDGKIAARGGGGKRFAGRCRRPLGAGPLQAGGPADELAGREKTVPFSVRLA